MAIKGKVKNQKESERERAKEIRKKGLCACAKNKLLLIITFNKLEIIHFMLQKAILTIPMLIGDG